MTQESPSKLYHSISEVAAITGIKAHVLRYWESEFPTLKPRKTKAGSRRYRQQDIEEIQAIKALLYEQGFRIEGARKMRRQAHAHSPAVTKKQLSLGFDQLETGQQLEVIRADLKVVLALVRQLGPAGAGKVHKSKKGLT